MVDFIGAISMDDELWLKAAAAMADRPCNIRFQRPITLDFDGQAMIIGGVPTVDIKPGFDDETTLYILAHECGYIRLGHAPQVDPDAKPGSQKLTPFGTKLRAIHPVTREQETGADRLASVWLDYARKHESEYSGNTKLERELKALAGYMPPELRLRVNNAALKAANEVLDLYIWKLKQEKRTNKGR
jgi:hypothetical protein